LARISFVGKHFFALNVKVGKKSIAGLRIVNLPAGQNHIQKLHCQRNFYCLICQRTTCILMNFAKRRIKLKQGSRNIHPQAANVRLPLQKLSGFV